jgi:beta-lactamase class C
LFAFFYRYLALFFLALYGTGAARAAGDPAPLRRIVDDAVRPLMAEHAVPGMAVAVTVNGRSAVFHYGWASREGKTPVDEHTLFEVGSISKTFTATLAAHAQAQGKLALSDRPSRHLPALAGSAVDRATLLHLGTYTAGGLPLQLPDDVADRDRMLAYFRQWKPEAAPGTQRRYSNPSIGLFGYATALALQMDFAKAMESELLRPLGLNHTYIHVPPRAMAGYAWGYSRQDKPVRVNPGLFDQEAYGIKTTAADLLRFVHANIEPARAPEPVRSAIAATHVGYFQVGDLVQGLGWEQFPYPITLERLLAGNARGMMMEPNAAAPPPRR